MILSKRASSEISGTAVEVVEVEVVDTVEASATTGGGVAGAGVGVEAAEVVEAAAAVFFDEVFLAGLAALAALAEAVFGFEFLVEGMV